MANPQLENGHLRVANEIAEALAKIRISGEEYQCLWVVLRKTYGWGKKEDSISLSQFSLLTGLRRPNVCRAIKKLVSKKILAVIKNETRGMSIYKINKDFESWKPLSKKIPGSLKIDNWVVSKKRHTKYNITKENIYSRVIEHLNEKTGKHYKVATPKTQALIKARLKEGFTLNDFFLVIDHQVSKWGNDPKMCQYLRPETLFGPKFESYFNAPPPIQKAESLPPYYKIRVEDLERMEAGV